jgi:hypothetical protein
MGKTPNKSYLGKVWPRARDKESELSLNFFGDFLWRRHVTVPSRIMLIFLAVQETIYSELSGHNIFREKQPNIFTLMLSEIKRDNFPDL